MSKASEYAATELAAAATVPPPWSAPSGLLAATVDSNGACILNVRGMPNTLNAADVLSLVAWVTTTFGP